MCGGMTLNHVSGETHYLVTKERHKEMWCLRLSTAR